MTTQPTHTPKLVLRDPVQLAVSIPYLLGFSPERSIVVTFAAESGRHVLTARCDLPSPLDPPTQFVDGLDAICEAGRADGATSVAAVIYPPADPDAIDVAQVVSDFVVAIPGLGLELLSVGSVRNGMWRDELEPEEADVRLAEAGVGTAAEWVARGVAFEESREGLSNRVYGPDTTRARAVRDFIEAQDDSWDREITRNRDARRRLEDNLLAYLHPSEPVSEGGGSSARIPVPDADVLASWAVGLADSRVREPVLWRLAEHTGGQGEWDGDVQRRMLDALCTLVRNTPEEDVAPLASCLAAFSWQLGNGAIAEIAAEHGLAADPRNVLCQLVRDAVTHGVHPLVWVEMLQAMSLEELRSGPRTRRHLRFRIGTADAPQVRDCTG
ncbi:MAG: DUF4192 domain-containing protein [Candidatus Nanopelagicales bacterium]